MTGFNPSWKDLAAAADTTPKQVVRRLQELSWYGARYDAFCDAVEDAFEFALTKAVEHKNIINPNSSTKARMDEDQITTMLSMVLLGMCFDITHSRNVGGNCDIVVTGPREMHWLGEAKIYSNYGKALGGYQQLCDRYSTGLENQNRGGFFLYHFGQKSGDVMQEWQTYLKDCREHLTVRPSASKQRFVSEEPHEGTGSDLLVKHMIVPLYHKPTDTGPRPPRKKAAK